MINSGLVFEYNGLTKKEKKINGKKCNMWTFDFKLLKN